MTIEPNPLFDEDACARLGTLAATVKASTAPDPREWSVIDRSCFPRSRWHRRIRLAFPLAAGLALALVIASRLTLSYHAEACTTNPQGLITTSGDHVGTLIFEEGSRFELDGGSIAGLRPAGFRRGAQLTLHRGRATMAIVPRFAGKWQVMAGPFKVRVTGTAFAVDWDPRSTHFRVHVTKGTVRVWGGPLNSDAHVGAGQSLDILLNTHEITWNQTNPRPTTIEKNSPAVSTPLPPNNASAIVPTSLATKKRRLAATKLITPSPVDNPRSGDLSPGLAPTLKLWQMYNPREADLNPEADIWASNHPSGALFVIAGKGTKFLPPANSHPTRLYKEHNQICTNVRIAGLSCAGNSSMTPSQDCDGSINWGVLLGWFPRSDHQPWGPDLAKRIAFDFRGSEGPYRLVAHHHGDPLSKVYCVEPYIPGQLVAPTDFKFECWTNKGKPLPDFTNVDFFAIHRPSILASQNVEICLGAVNLE